MSVPLFELFVQTMEEVPDMEMLKAIELEQAMLESSSMYKCILETPEADSILSFCQFVNAATDEDSLPPIRVPFKHIFYYRKFVRRMVAVGHLPYSAREKFDVVFDSPLYRAVAGN